MLKGFTPIPADFAARYRAKGYWLDQPMGQYFRAIFDKWDKRVAVVAGASQVTYRELGDRIDHLARHLLDYGIKPLDRVVVQLPNRIEFIYLYFALVRVGAIPLLALPPHRKYEIEHYIKFIDAVGYASSKKAGDFSFLEMAREIRGSAPSLKHLFISDDDVPSDCISIRALMKSEPTASPAALDRTSKSIRMSRPFSNCRVAQPEFRKSSRAPTTTTSSIRWGVRRRMICTRMTACLSVYRSDITFLWHHPAFRECLSVGARSRLPTRHARPTYFQ